MDTHQLEKLAIIRIVIGYLGEQAQFGWWQSAFFAPGSQAFLAPLFARTQLLARSNGVTRAASLIHDARIGVGQVYHLFRLPEDMEQSLHQALYAAELCEQIAALVTSQETTLTYLRQRAIPATPGAIGPVRMGHLHALRQPASWSQVAAQYARAFENGSEVYPYFADIAKS